MELSFRLNKPVDFVFEYLTDMRKFASLHPVISRIDKIDDNNFMVHETLTFGFIPISFSYPVLIEILQNEKIAKMHAKVFKLIKVEMQFVLKPEGNICIVEECIQFKSPLPVKFIMKGIFKKHHTQLFNNIELV